MREIQLVADLADPLNRAVAAAALAQRLGSDDLIVFIRDPLLGTPLPAPGFPQTLPGRAWRRFLARCQGGRHTERLPFGGAGLMQTAVGVPGDDGTLLVLLGTNAPSEEGLAAVQPLLPLLGAALEGEWLTQVLSNEVNIARQSTVEAETLAERLEQTRTELERALRKVRETEELLAAEKERLAVTLLSIGDGVITTDTDGRVVLLNKVAQKLTGWSQEAAEHKPLQQVFNIVDEISREPCENPVEKVLRTSDTVELANHTVLIARDGTERMVADSGAPIRDKDGRVLGVVLVFRDVTEKRRVEDELIKAQKLESIGVLAGGIAHDFNNILTAIFGNISLAKMHPNSHPGVAKALAETESAFWRARDLTHQLLTFAKGGAPIRKTASIAEVLTESVAFVLRGSNINGEFRLPDDLWPVKFDRGQISQVVNNLLINAREAMPGGGTVKIEACNLHVGPREIPRLTPGRYVRIVISDQGVGIPEHHLDKIFDPYFSTKQEGSGLGLATAYSIVKRHDGHMAVTSKPGQGAAFSVFLPASDEAIAPPPGKTDNETYGGKGRILLMDGEESVRKVGGALLAQLGYDVEISANGAQAIQLYRRAMEQRRPFTGVIMDLTVRGGMGGEECIRRLKEIDPGVRAVVSSGYSTHPVMADFARHGFRGVISKPYEIRELSEALHAALQGPVAL